MQSPDPADQVSDPEQWTVRLLDAGSRPLPDASVFVLSIRDERTTDGEGRFQIPLAEELLMGYVRVTIDGRRFGFFVERDNQDLRLATSVPVEVVLLDGKSGDPLAGGMVAGYNRASSEYVPLDPCGSLWRFLDPQFRTRGEVFTSGLEIRPPEGYVLLHGSYQQETIFAEYAREIRHRVVLWPASDLRARVREIDGTPTKGVTVVVNLPGDLTVEMKDGTGEGSLSAESDEQGKVRLRGIPAIPGERYRIEAMSWTGGRGFRMARSEEFEIPDEGRVPEIELTLPENYLSRKEMRERLFPAGSSAVGGNATGPAPGSVRLLDTPELLVIVLDERDRPVPCAEVRVVGASGVLPIVVAGVQEIALLTDRAGRVSIPGLPPEEVEVRAFYGSRSATARAEPGGVATLRLSR